MFERYIQIKDEKIICGQTSQGVWYCKELPAKTTQELKILIGEVNQILNKYNESKREGNPKPSTSPKSKVRM